MRVDERVQRFFARIQLRVSVEKMSRKTKKTLRITLVPGTWARGVFPGLQFWKRSVLWFEVDGTFRRRLSTELRNRNIRHEIRVHEWSYENSIFVRDASALDLARRLQADSIEYPMQMVIAHSHGGNLALRALKHLGERRAELTAARHQIRLVTMACPFVEIYHANTGLYAIVVRWALGMAVVSLAVDLYNRFLQNSATGLYLFVLGFLNSVFLGRQLFLGNMRRNKIANLVNATSAKVEQHYRRMLIIRAIDDEASLALTLGAVLNRSVPKLLVLVCTTVWVALLARAAGGVFGEDSWITTAEKFFGILPYALFGFLCLLGLARAIYGREIAFSPMECQINVQSAPDGVELSRLVTLPERQRSTSLRHGIYNAEACAGLIADWVLDTMDETRPFVRQ